MLPYLNKEFFFLSFLSFLSTGKSQGLILWGGEQNSPLPHLICAYTCTQHLEKLPPLYRICYSAEFLRIRKI